MTFSKWIGRSCATLTRLSQPCSNEIVDMLGEVKRGRSMQRAMLLLVNDGAKSTFVWHTLVQYAYVGRFKAEI